MGACLGNGLDLKIEYRPGSGNKKADALSRHPVRPLIDDDANQPTPAVVAALEASTDGNKVSGITLREKQRLDPDLQLLITFLEDHALPEDDRKARELVLGRAQYTMIEGVLYRIESDKTLRVLVPVGDRENLFKEAHSGKCGRHLREVKIHSQLSRHYWWPGMRQDITKWCRACLVCATRSVGKPIKPSLTPIPVCGPSIGLVSMYCNYPSQVMDIAMPLYSWTI